MSWTPHHPGDASGERPRADELFAELSRIDLAPDDLTARVMGQVGYRPVTTLEVGRRRRRTLMIRVATFGLTTVALAGAALHLRSTEGRHVDAVTVDTAVAQDMTNARTRVASALTGLRRLAPAAASDSAAASDAEGAMPIPGTPAAVLSAGDRSPAPAGATTNDAGGDLPGELRGLFTDVTDFGGDEDGPRRGGRSVEPELSPPMPWFGPAGFPSGGRGIERLGPARLSPGGLGTPARPNAVPGVEDARLGPLTRSTRIAAAEWRA